MRLHRILVVAVLAHLAFAVSAGACPVCFGEAEAPILDGARWSVVFLGGLVYLLLGGVGTAFWLVRRNALKQLEKRQDPHHGLRLISTESNG